MQTKATIFFLSVSLYLLGLVGYSNRQAASESSASAALLQASTAKVSDTFLALDASKLMPKSRTPKPVEAPQSKLKVAKADPVIVGTIHDFNDDIKKKDAEKLAKLIEKTAERYSVDPLLVTALVSQESAFYIDAVSPVGAIGLGQLMPYTAADLGVDPHDPVQNLDGCVRYLAQNLDAWAHTDDAVTMALASYNAGPGAVASYGGVPPYEETQHYVEIINHRYDSLLSETVASNSKKDSIYG